MIYDLNKDIETVVSIGIMLRLNSDSGNSYDNSARREQETGATTTSFQAKTIKVQMK